MVEAEGHLIDSQILNVVFDTVVKHNASFDVLKFNIGRRNDEPSSIAMRISAATEGGLEDVERGVVADHRVEHRVHQLRVDQVAFGFDHLRDVVGGQCVIA